jgi:outer membrane protein OmpA-like peptidoglycan-associated protein
MRAQKKMMPRAILGFVAAALATVPALAGEPTSSDPAHGSKQGGVGAVAGLAVGALAGGPIGAFIGFGVGAVMGDSYHRQLQTKSAMQQQLQHDEAERSELNASIAQLDTSLAHAREHGEQLDQTLRQTDDLGVDVSFRTNDDAVSTQAMSPLLKLGALVASIPQARLRVAGYADPRGPESLNEALSLRRAESVAAVLVSAGVPRERVSVEGHGAAESVSEPGDLDAYAFERRVSVRMQLAGDSQVARNDR